MHGDMSHPRQPGCGEGGDSGDCSDDHRGGGDFCDHGNNEGGGALCM